jgi:23S rRNA (adenine2503-C2)-methyltransferase
MTPTELIGSELPQIEQLVAAMGNKPLHARQIYQWIYARRAHSFRQMTDLPAALRARLEQACSLGHPRIQRVAAARDGTRKYLLEPVRGGQVEAVFIPEPRRITFCLSPQIGCALDCRFCHTALLGLTRHLGAGEIVGQALALLEDNEARIGGRPVNVVMMGMGEALHNYDETLAAIRILADPRGVGIPIRRITLSTAGLAPAIRKLAAEPVRPRLAVSLNATTDEVRTTIMPINKRHPIAELMEACASWTLTPRERITFEYVLLAGVNDTARDARRLASLIHKHQLRAKVNLIPFNAGSGLPFKEPSRETIAAFQKDLLAHGVAVSVRANRGRDIAAACGQLALAEAGPPLH